jgi:hypothetical protein
MFNFISIRLQQLATAGISRRVESLSGLLDTISLVPQGDELVLESSNDKISKLKKRPSGEELEQLIKEPVFEGADSIHDLLVTGLMELCKVKPVGNDAIKWLGEWLIEKNPNRPTVAEDGD